MVELVSRIGLAAEHRYSTPSRKSGASERLEVIVTDGPGKLQLVFFASVGLHAQPAQAGLDRPVRGDRVQLPRPPPAGAPRVRDAPRTTNDKPLMTAEIAERVRQRADRRSTRPARSSARGRSPGAIDAVLDTLRRGRRPAPGRGPRAARPVATGAAPSGRSTARRTAPTLTHARNRLKWDEAFAVQVALAQRRQARRGDARGAAPAPSTTGCWPRSTGGCRSRSPQGQRAVGEEIAARPGLRAPDAPAAAGRGRLGQDRRARCGRCSRWSTRAARRRCSRRPRCSRQQHYRSITALLGPLGRGRRARRRPTQATRVALLTGSPGGGAPAQRAGRRVHRRRRHRGRHPRPARGPGAVRRPRPGGGRRAAPVRRRAARRAAGQGRGARPHVLVMTATPIPRTVAMTVFGDLEISTLSELPGGPSPIATHVVPAAERPRFLDRAWQRVREEVAAGHQAYVVCPRIGSGRRPGRRRRRHRRGRRRPRPRDRGRGTAQAEDGAPAAAGRPRRRPGAGRRARWPGCASASCTAGCRPTRRTR